ncbi:MAG: NAD(P)-dependent alcohol dehydrogenase [Saprospiraceae bacterium]|nr:NAD(P)-dependent alcohol dehydrogenase [Saprospiraceae bacterium]
MKAAVYHQYGAPDVVSIQDIAKPVPSDNEILIKMYAAAVTSGDGRLRRADPFGVRLFFGLFKPRVHILGDGFSGVVEAVGKNVTKFKPGDHVFGTCGMKFGAHVEYKCLPENGVVAIKPEAASHEQAAAVHFGGATALFFLRKAGVRAGQKVLIYGASGAVGSAAVQIAKYLGAEVTGVCSTANLEMVKNLGADQVIDYTKQDLSTLAERYDVVYEAVGKMPLSRLLPITQAQGKVILGAAMLAETLRGAWASLTGKKKVISGVAIETPEILLELKKMMEAGRLNPFIDRQFPLDRIADVHAHVEGGRKRGNVVVVV